MFYCNTRINIAGPSRKSLGSPHTMEFVQVYRLCIFAVLELTCKCVVVNLQDFPVQQEKFVPLLL